MLLGLTNVHHEGIVTSERNGRENGEKDCTNSKIRTFLESEILKKEAYTEKRGRRFRRRKVSKMVDVK